MEFDPANKVVKLCLQGMDLEGRANNDEARERFMEAWENATNDFEKYLGAYYLARHQSTVSEQLQWAETALTYALKIDDETVRSAYPSLYENIAQCHADLGDPDNAKKHRELASSYKDNLSDKGPFYHGTKAHLQVGDLLTAGFGSNYKADLIMNHIYFTASVNGAGLAAALAKGEGRERVYMVEPTGSFQNDPNVTDKKFPGNPTRSYRSQAPVKILREVTDWVKTPPEVLQKWRERLADLDKSQQSEIIN